MAEHSFTAKPDALDIITTYVFDASPEKVFAAYVNPELISQWWGPENQQTTVEEMDPTIGGSWRFTVSGSEGQFKFRGVYHDIQAPEKLVATWQFVGVPRVILQTITFAATDGKTMVTDQMVFQSVADRDAMLQSCMDGGSVHMLERLAQLV